MFLLLVLIIMLLLSMSGLISATETAITASSPGKIQRLRSDGNKRASTVLKILKIKDKVISTLLIGGSISNTICTTLATGMFIEILGDDLGTIVSSIVMSFAIIIFAEIIPKAIAVAKPEKVTMFVTPVLKIFLSILKPINFILSYTIRLFCFIFRVDLTPDISAEEEVRGVIEHHMNEGNVFRDDRDMLGGVLDIRNMKVSDIMVHRSHVESINIDIPPKNIIEKALSFPHTRIPIWEESKDNIIGILHIKQLLSLVATNQNVLREDIIKLLTKPWYIPENALATMQLQAFREGQSHLACVVDEYGDIKGIITLEDILEEIVGQIYDEHDHESKKIVKQSETEFIIDGSVSVREINRELHWRLPENTATTLAGFVIHAMERIPSHGEFVMFQNIKLIVTQKFVNRIKTIRAVVQISEDEMND
jgi:Mg2+/Co2+ transporter CorB